MNQHYLELFVTTFVTFFVLIDAVGVAPIFAALAAPGGRKFAGSMAIRSPLVAGGVLLFFGAIGPWLLTRLGISLDAFRAAGGVLLFLIALEMVFEKRQQRREERAEQVLAEEEAGLVDDISVFPLGIPMIAGPGSIASTMLYMQNTKGDPVAIAIVGAAIALNLVLTAVIFLLSGPMIRIVGESVAGAVTRIFGVILTALAAQLLIDGIKGAFGIG